MTNLTKQEQAEELAIAWHPHWWQYLYSDCVTERKAAIREAEIICERLNANGFEIVRKEKG
jgi:hypothetical protein